MNHKLIINQTFKRFYIPTAIGTVMLAVSQISNLIFAGYFFGKDGSFTIGLTLPIVIFTEIIVYLFGMGGGIAISAYVGGGKKKSANQVFTSAVLGALFLGILSAVFSLLFMDGLLKLLGAEGYEQMTFVRGYVRITALGMPILLISPILNILVRNDNRPTTAMMGIAGAAVMNAVLIIIFIGLLGYGIEFIAVSTVISHVFASLLYVSHFKGCHSTLKLSKNITFPILLSIIKPGFVGAMIFLAQMFLTVYINHTLKSNVGYSGIAIYGVIKYIVTFVYAVYDGVNHSVQPMLGVYYGEKDSRSILYTAKIALKTIVCGSVIIAVIIAAAATHISEFFGIDVNTAVYITALSCLFSAVVAFFNSYYRSVGKERISLLLLVLDNLIFPILLIQIFVFGFKQEVNGIWLALLFSEILTLTVILGISFVSRGRGVFILDVSSAPAENIFDVIIHSRESDVMALNFDIDKFCKKNGIKAKIHYYISLCVEEIAVNIINHGMTKSKGHYINIRITADEDITLIIRDDSVKYDPTQKSDIDKTVSIESRNVDDLGIYLVKQIASEFSYKRVIGFNSLYIVLKGM